MFLPGSLVLRGLCVELLLFALSELRGRAGRDLTMFEGGPYT
jgi:hypothetical protein